MPFNPYITPCHMPANARTAAAAYAPSWNTLRTSDHGLHPYHQQRKLQRHGFPNQAVPLACRITALC
jgi:hypothetical protein